MHQKSRWKKRKKRIKQKLIQQENYFSIVLNTFLKRTNIFKKTKKIRRVRTKILHNYLKLFSLFTLF